MARLPDDFGAGLSETLGKLDEEREANVGKVYPPALQREFEKARKAIVDADFRPLGKNEFRLPPETIQAYKQAALERLAQDFDTIARGDANQQASAQAVFSIEQLSNPDLRRNDAFMKGFLQEGAHRQRWTEGGGSPTVDPSYLSGNQRFADMSEREAAGLSAAIPSWANPENVKTDWGKASTFVKSGFSERTGANPFDSFPTDGGGGGGGDGVPTTGVPGGSTRASVEDVLDGREPEYDDNRQYVDYDRIAARDRPELTSDQLIDESVVDGMRSYFERPDFAVDETGLDAQRSALDYFQGVMSGATPENADAREAADYFSDLMQGGGYQDADSVRASQYFNDLLDNEGRDAVSQAHLVDAQNQAEQVRRSNVLAALSDLDRRGMGGSGSELQAHLQGADQSMQAQYRSAVESAALEQQRRDAAARQLGDYGDVAQKRADSGASSLMEYGSLRDNRQDAAAQQLAQGGYNLRGQQFGEEAQKANNIDQLTSQREQLRARIAEINSGREFASAQQYEQYSRQLDQVNAEIQRMENTTNVNIDNTELSLRNRYQEGSTAQAEQLLAQAINRDAEAIARDLAQQAGMDAAQTQTFIQQINAAGSAEDQRRLIDAKMSEMGFQPEDLIEPLAQLSGTIAGSAIAGPAGAGAGGSFAGNIAVPNTELTMPTMGQSYTYGQQPQLPTFNFSPQQFQLPQPMTGAPGAGALDLDDF